MHLIGVCLHLHLAASYICVELGRYKCTINAGVAARVAQTDLQNQLSKCSCRQLSDAI